MAIQVTCPSCLKRFSVSDKFAGKSGPCPNCQKQIKIPEKQDEVVIHAPDDGPKDIKGKSILKPIRRTEVKLSMPVAVGSGLAALVVVGIAIGLGMGDSPPPIPLLAISAVLLAPPLVFTGYWFLHDDELEGFRGRQLWIRCGVGALLFAAIWAIYMYVPRYLNEDDTINGLQIVFLLPVMIALGATISVVTFELEIIQGVLHYMLYLGVTFALAWLAGAPLLGPTDESTPGLSPPAIVRPAPPSGQPAPGKATPPTSPTQPEEPEKRINILQ